MSNKSYTAFFSFSFLSPLSFLRTTLLTEVVVCHHDREDVSYRWRKKRQTSTGSKGKWKKRMDLVHVYSFGMLLTLLLVLGFIFCVNVVPVLK